MLFFLLLFILGTIFWSFGSVLLLRLDWKYSWEAIRSIITGRSQCPSCHHVLAPWQLIPLWWWIVQRWRCSFCQQKISTLYPVCEIVSWLVFVLRWLLATNYDWWMSHIILLPIWWLMGLILVWDMYSYELHTKIWLLLSVVVIVWIAIIGDWHLVWWAAIGLSVFVLLYLFARLYVAIRFAGTERHIGEGMGMGDVMMAPIIGSLIAFALTWSQTLWTQSFFLVDMSVIGIIQLIIVFILGTCLLWLCWYAVSRLFFSSNLHHPDWSQGAGPVIPFLPSMIMMYWIIVFFL